MQAIAQSLSTLAGKTKTAPAVPSFDAASSAINEILDTVYDIFEHHTLSSELINAHNTILNKMRLGSDLFDAIQPPLMAPIAPEPSTRSVTKDYASCKVQTDPVLPITAIVPNTPVKKSFAQAAKAPAFAPSDKPDKASTSTPTQPLAPASASVDNVAGPFKGRRATKPNEIHIQLRSRAAFNSSLLQYTDLKLNHRHALHSALVNAVSVKINKKTHSYFLDNHIESAFWSPRGNLIIRTKRTPSVQLQTLLLDTIEMICGGRHFVVLARPTLSLLKLRNIPTCNSDGSPVDLDSLTADLFHDPRLTKASFWHLPWFVLFKGAPLG
ncbi:hypothetical protein AX14_009384 [Amanita brunnescens Koide BX004]|nr:hypothetical protein AX14_009384 [Amanita brunnescens Koide BX004]